MRKEGEWVGSYELNSRNKRKRRKTYKLLQRTQFDNRKCNV